MIKVKIWDGTKEKPDVYFCDSFIKSKNFYHVLGSYNKQLVDPIPAHDVETFEVWTQ